MSGWHLSIQHLSWWHLSISTISDPIQTNLFGGQHFVRPKIFGFKIIWTKIILGQKFFLDPIFFGPKVCFNTKVCFTQNFLDQNYFGPNIFQTQHILDTKFLCTQIFGTHQAQPKDNKHNNAIFFGFDSIAINLVSHN